MPWKEDSRNNTKRNNARSFKKQHYRNISQKASEKPHLHVGIVDVADSSDDRYYSDKRHSWTSVNTTEDDYLNGTEIEEGADFEILQKAPVNSYTVFESEKNWDSSDNIITNKTNDCSSYFTLNLSIIKNALEAIPFYKRMDYSKSLFDVQDIRRMNYEGEIAEKSYQSMLNNQNLDKISDLNIEDKPKSQDSNSKVKSPPKKNGEGENAEKKNTEEIQQWLDNIL